MRKMLPLAVLLLLSAALVNAQNREITGKITDSTGVAIAGASVNVKGIKKGTSASSDGTFRLSVPEKAILIISAVGYEAQEVAATGMDNITIQLHTSGSRVLNEIVVTALGIKRERRSLGSATQTIDADQLNKSGTGNPLSELSGKAAGLTVINRGGDPGSGTYIRLRGVTSITGTNQPLIVVDGVPSAREMKTSRKVLSPACCFQPTIRGMRNSTWTAPMRKATIPAIITRSTHQSNLSPMMS